MIINEEVETPAMTDTVKYLIVFLAVLSAALVFVIGYVAMRMCSRRRDTQKLQPALKERRLSQPKQDAQFVVPPDEAKDIFGAGRRRKARDADSLAEGTASVASSSRGFASQ